MIDSRGINPQSPFAFKEPWSSHGAAVWFLKATNTDGQAGGSRRLIGHLVSMNIGPKSPSPPPIGSMLKSPVPSMPPVCPERRSGVGASG